MNDQGDTILVVDDEDEVRDYARSVLEAQGYRVLTARNSVEALLLSDHHRGPIRLLITDVSMPPYMDGFGLARSLSEVRPGLGILFISTRPADDMIEGGFMDGNPFSSGHGPSFLPKPFTPESLVRQVHEIIDPRTRPGPSTPTADECRTILIMVPVTDLRSSVATLLREEGYMVLEVRNIGDALILCQWHVGRIGLLLADRGALAVLPSELLDRLVQIRPEMRILCASICCKVEAPLGERVKRALEEWGLEAQGGP